MKHKYSKINYSVAMLASSLAFVGSASAVDVIVNGSFENGTTGWLGLGTVYASTYGGDGSQHAGIIESPTAAPYGGDPGANFGTLVGGSAGGPGLFQASQIGDFNALIGDAGILNAITAGTAQFTFSSWVGGYVNNDDYTRFEIEFYDGAAGSGNILGGTTLLVDGLTDNNVQETVVSTPANTDDLNNSVISTDLADWNQHNWSRYETTGTIPAGAQSFVLNYQGFATNNNGNDAYADLVVLDVTQVPEPSSCALGTLGGAFLLLRRKRS